MRNGAGVKSIIQNSDGVQQKMWHSHLLHESADIYSFLVFVDKLCGVTAFMWNIKTDTFEH